MTLGSNSTLEISVDHAPGVHCGAFGGEGGLDCKKVFQIHRLDCLFLTDSTIVVQYIHTFRIRLSTFIANKLANKYDETSVERWRYVKSAENPADQCSRGLKNLQR